MKQRNLYIRRLEIVDEHDNTVYKVKDVPLKQGMEGAISVISSKDGVKTVRKIFAGFSKYLDDEFKALFNMERD